MITNRKNLKILALTALLIGAAAGIAVIFARPSFSSNVLIVASLFVTSLVLVKVLFKLENLETNPTLRNFLSTLLEPLFSKEEEKTGVRISHYSRLFLSNIVEGSVSSRAQLGQALAELGRRSFSLLPIRGIEVSLCENSTSYYFFSFMMGQVPLEHKENILELPLSFSAKVLGTVRFCVEKDRRFKEEDLELAKLLTMQVGILFVNAEYSSELLKMQQSADETLRAKTGFLANLSHEVRSPLGVIINATELVLDGLCGEISNDQKRILSLAKSGGEHLLELIGDVLDYAKIEAGKLAPQKKNIAVDEILKDVTNIVRFQADQKKIEVGYDASVEALAVNVDRKHFRQILINLLTNAVKYTPDGGKIEVWAERAPSNLIRINVKDSGVGIDPSQREKVFAPFERLNHTYSRQQAGVGLGLSLAKRLAEINGGLLDFESKLGSGSRFWVLLKSTEIDLLDKKESTVSKNAIRSKGEELVIIDHDTDHLSIICRYLADLGYQIKSFTNQESAKEELENGKAKLVIIDNTELDDADSSAGAAISHLVETKQTPVLLLSSRAFIFDIEKYLKLGVERCLPKPVPLKELALLCRQILDSRGIESDVKIRDGAKEIRRTEEIPGQKPSKDLLH